MVQSGYKFRTGLASNYIVYRGLQINYFRTQKKGPFLSECVEICYKIKSFSQKLEKTVKLTPKKRRKLTP